MASRIENEPDNEDDILYVKRQKKDRSVYGGYKREYLARNLTEMEDSFVICKICVGNNKKCVFIQGRNDLQDL